MAKKHCKSRRRRLLLVTDMLNGFVDPRGSMYCGPAAEKIVPFVRRTILSYRRRAWPVVFVAESHPPDDPEFSYRRPHCIRATWEAQIVPQLPIGDSPVVHKRTFSCFYRTRLASTLNRIGVRDVDVVGLCTDICVLFAALELRVRGYHVRVLSRGVASFDNEAHELALKKMHDYHCLMVV